MTENTESQKSSGCFLVESIVKYYKEQHDEIMRFPQFLYHELAKVKPHITENILGTKNDFFYDHKLSNEKWEHVSEWWDR